MKISHSKWMLATVFSVSVSGCGMWDVTRQSEAPPPPNVRGFRALQVPADLRVNRPPSNPSAADLARALAPTVPVPVAVAVPVTAVAVVAPAVVEPLTPAIDAQTKGLFTPYFPTSASSTPPNVWTAEPKYDFPWINGAVPTRVNEEVTFGSGSLMLGRLYAKVTYGEQVMPTVAKQMAAKPVDAPKTQKGSVLSRVFKVFTGSDDQPAESVVKPPETPMSMSAESMACNDVTCLDIARDMLVDDAKTKGWSMIFNRRISLHQSYQFSREGRLIGIEVHSTGGKLLTIEYNLMPAQVR